MMASEFATLSINGQDIKLPIIVGTEGEKAIDITALRKTTGCLTFDPGLMNTAVCRSSITYVNGEKGILCYRGIPIEKLVADEKLRFVHIAYLLVHGNLPSPEEARAFSSLLNVNSLLHEDMRHFFDLYPRGAHPMHILSTMINALAVFYPNVDLLSFREDIDKIGRAHV